VNELKLPYDAIDEDLLLFKNLTTLDCKKCQNITDVGICELRELTTLNCKYCDNITDV
jgi:hypothetical protein